MVKNLSKESIYNHQDSIGKFFDAKNQMATNADHLVAEACRSWHTAAMDAKKKHYYRGFLLSDTKLDVPDEFARSSFGGCHFYCHVKLAVCVFSDILFAGHAIDVTNGLSDIRDIARELNELLTTSEDSMLDRIDQLSGRFMVFYRIDKVIRILNDAAGMNAIFYSTDRMVAGSHAKLVADAVGTERSNQDRFRRGYPGAATPFDGVMILTPNSLLEWPSRAVRRYFPRKPLTEMPLDDAKNIVLHGFRQQLEAIEGRVVVSLTAGIDSRLTLAATRHFDYEYFTYRLSSSRKKRIQAVDVSVATEIARRYGLRHRVISVPENDPDFREFNRVADENSYQTHARRLTLAYAKLFSGAMHLRSNVGEIGKAFYLKSGNPRPPLDCAAHVALAYDLHVADQALVQRNFAEFMERTQFSEIYNYDPFDMLYWEHRIGCWFSHVVLESDMAFDTHVLFNSRSIIKAMLALPLEDRIKATLFHGIIRDELPEIDDIPINPRRTLEFVPRQ